MKNSLKTGTRGLLFALLQGFAVALLPVSSAGAAPAIVGMGDSIGQGTQADDAAWQTQVFSYLNWISFQMGGDLTIPYIQSNFLGATQDAVNRFRIFPADVATNVSVSGADLNDLLNTRSDALSVAEINNEVDLVMFPRLQSQMEYLESVAAETIICWIGNNDVLAAVISYDNLNASQMTPLAAFDADYIQLADRLQAQMTTNGSRVVLANIPNVTDIGFLVDRATAESITGFPVNLPDGHFTATITAILMLLQGNDLLMSDPAFVLDSAELASIQSRVQDFNAVIQREADRIGVPVVDINTRFAEIVATPPIYFGRPLTKFILGGLFSNDGVHPSNIGHALVANEFIRTMNLAYGTTVPELSQEVLDYMYLTDPSIDKDLDGKATGRFGVGIIETVYFFFGLTGDTNDFLPN